MPILKCLRAAIVVFRSLDEVRAPRRILSHSKVGLNLLLHLEEPAVYFLHKLSGRVMIQRPALCPFHFLYLYFYQYTAKASN